MKTFENFNPNDVIALCKGVMKISANYWDNPDGGYESRCPFCSSMVSKDGGKGDVYVNIEKIPHRLDCVYLMAKDLLTGLQ